jgi:hypothetical protein
LPIGDNERAECAESFKSFVAMLLGGIFINWSTWSCGISSIDMLRLPDEVLEEIALVLGKEKVLSLFDDIAEISYQSLTFGRELLGWVGHGARIEEAV